MNKKLIRGVVYVDGKWFEAVQTSEMLPGWVQLSYLSPGWWLETEHGVRGSPPEAGPVTMVDEATS